MLLREKVILQATAAPRPRRLPGAMRIAPQVRRRFTFADPSFSVSAANVAPVACVNFGTVTIDEGSCVSVSLDGWDASCADRTAGLLYSFAVDGPPGSYEIAPAGNCATISFYDNGSFTVYATVTDKDGGSSQYTLKAVTANNVAPTGCFSVNPTTLDEGGSVAACITDGYDPSCVDTLDYGLHYSFAVGRPAWPAVGPRPTPHRARA